MFFKTRSDPFEAVQIRRSARARRLSLRVSSLDGRVTLTIPKGLSGREAQRFLDQHREWIAGQLSGLPDRVDVATSDHLLFRGARIALVPASVRSTRLADDRQALLVPGSAQNPARAIRAFLRLAARDALARASDHYADQLGRSYASITLRDPRSRWGSCSADGRLMYSWRLIMAEPAVLNYVAAHEVAHLDQMNHSPAFWKVVADLCPDYARHRSWLRENGSSLHQWNFGD